MSQGVHLRKYGVAATIDFELYEVDGVDFRTNWTPAEGDVFMMRDEAGEEQVTNAGGEADLSTLVADEGRGYSITLALEDMQAARVAVYLVDQGEKVFLDKVLIIETYGNASAQHAFDLDTASAAQSADNDTKLDTIITGVNVTSEADIDFGAAKKTSLNAATTDLTAITGDKASYKATGFAEAGDVMKVSDGTGANQVDLTDGKVTVNNVNDCKATGFALATVVGALDNAAAAGAVTEADTLMQYLKQLINILIGGPGVVTFPAEAAPGDGVSLAEVIRAIHVDVTGLNGEVMVGTNGANTVEPDATGAAAALHATTDAKIDTTDGLIGGLNNVSVANLNTACDTVTVTSMANDVITAASINTGAIAADAVDSTALDNVVMSDLEQGAPSATASIVIAINVLYEAFRNKTLTTATLITIMKDDGTTDLMKSTISDAGGTTTKEEFVSG